MKAELVQMLVNEHKIEVKRAENETEEQLAMMTKPVMEEVNKESSEDTESESEEEDVTKSGSAQPPQVIFIPPALQPQPFDPTAVAR